jgi:hypothetical protein
MMLWQAHLIRFNDGVRWSKEVLGSFVERGAFSANDASIDMRWGRQTGKGRKKRCSVQ